MLARVNHRWLLAVLIVLGLAAIVMPILNPPPADVPPTLVGLTGPAHDPIPIPQPTGDPIQVAEPRPIGITVLRPAPGVPLADARDLEAAAGLLVRGDATGSPRLGPFVHRVVDGLPAVELANGDESWTAVNTYLFGSDLIIEVVCMLAKDEPEKRLADCASAVESLVLT